jgi:GntP family gluconate:H+ symporter
MGSAALLIGCIALVVVATGRLQVHPFLALLAAAFAFGAGSGMPLPDLVGSINQGFGGTLGSIGIVIVAGCVIGTFLERSGGAARIAAAVLRLTGSRRVPMAMGLTGYVVSLPVFCDSGFVLLSPLNRALAGRAGTSVAAGAIALSLGLYATHTMVPPTPGPVAAAGILGADLGRVVLFGLAVSAVALAAGLVFATRIASRFTIDADGAATSSASAPAGDAPSTPRAVLPIVVPMVLIVLRTIAELPARPFGAGGVAQLFSFVGQPVVALLIGAAFAFALPRRIERAMFSTRGWVGDAVVSAATILVITGAGGAFGKVLQNSGIADTLGGAIAGLSLGIWLPFLIAAAIKTAQGSSTVAIITTASLVAPLLVPLGLDGEAGRALAVVAIGAGSMVVSHANDSYFWVVTQFSGMDVETGVRLQTVGTLVEGVAAAAAVALLGAVLL